MVLQGDRAGAMIEARRAQEIEPLSPLVNAGTAHTLFLARRYDQAVAECEKSLEVDPNFIFAIHVMGMCRAQQARLTEAIEIGERTVSMSGRAPFYLGVLGHYYARSGASDKVHDILEELAGLAGTRYVPPHCFAYIYAGANDLDRAFEWQAKAYDDGASPFYYFSPLIENLHGRSSSHRVDLRRMGFADRVNVSIDCSRAWDVVMIALLWRLGPERDWCGDRMASLAARDEIAESAEITGTKGTEKAAYTEERSNGGRNGEDCKKTRATGGRQRRPRVIVTDRRKIQTPQIQTVCIFVDS